MARKLIGQHTRILLQTHTHTRTKTPLVKLAQACTSMSYSRNTASTWLIVTREERKEKLKESRHQLNVFYTFYKNWYATLFGRQAFWFSELTLAAQFVG